jgi:DNA-binding NtrC family response regulator
VSREAILCVDDEAVILLAMKQELKRRFGSRYLIETALDASEAGAVIAELDEKGIRTALVISDWFMPGVRGDRFLVELRTRRPEIRSILITGNADDESVEKARAGAGICACLRKPWRSDELASTIEACIAGTFEGG